jgi:hypothetical protein
MLEPLFGSEPLRYFIYLKTAAVPVICLRHGILLDQLTIKAAL